MSSAENIYPCGGEWKSFVAQELVRPTVGDSDRHGEIHDHRYQHWPKTGPNVPNVGSGCLSTSAALRAVIFDWQSKFYLFETMQGILLQFSHRKNANL